MKILVSNCLLGCPCRYDGASKPVDWVVDLAKEYTLIGVCPEQMGGLSTPRDPSEIVGERVLSREGRDVTQEYERGAQTALRLATLNRVHCAILKSGSPSCGKGEIYDGTFSGTKIEGNGVTVQALEAAGIAVFTENDKDIFEQYMDDKFIEHAHLFRDGE